MEIEFLQDAPFHVTFSTQDLKFTEAVEFKAKSSWLEDIENVSSLTGSFPLDQFCAKNFLEQAFCGTNFTKTWEKGRHIV